MSKHDWQIIEDNGGGLHLFIFSAGSNSPVAGGHDYEYLTSADFLATLERIEAPDFTLSETRDWSGMYDDPQTAYDALTANDLGWKSIAVYEDGQRTLHVNRMGRAGREAFGLE